MKTFALRVLVPSLVASMSFAVACSSSTTNGGSDGGVTEDDAAVVVEDATVPVDAASSSDKLDGKYAIKTWTCATKDILAFAATLQIQGINETFSGATGSIETVYPAGCTRTVPISSISYPGGGKVTSTAGGTRTCAASCPSNQCTAGTEADVTVTYAFTLAGNVATFTRDLDAAMLAGVSIQSAAGCKAGDKETLTLQK